MVKYKLNQTSLGDVPFCALLASKFVIYRRKHQVEFLHLSKVSVQKKTNFSLLYTCVLSPENKIITHLLTKNE